jgi:hypothetical protein
MIGISHIIQRRLLALPRHGVPTKAAFAQILVCLFLLLSFGGCHDKSSELRRMQEDVIYRADALFTGYEEGSVDRARQSLKSRIELYEGSTALHPAARLDMIARDYARLYLLEKRTGEDEAAEAALVKVRYWYLCVFERQGRSAREAVGLLQKLIPGELEATVDDIDQRVTKGKGLRYVRDIQGGGKK